MIDADISGPVNLGNPQEMTINGLARAIVRATGSSSKIVYESLPVDDPKVRQPDITLARTLLDWAPRVQFDEGLARTIEHFRQKLA